MDSFVQTSSSRSLPKGARVMLPRNVQNLSETNLDKALLLNGLECRAQVGTCKLRFVSRSEDVWYSNMPRTAAKRAAAAARRESHKRQRLQNFICARYSETGSNVLAGLGHPQPAPLPSAHKLKPVD